MYWNIKITHRLDKLVNYHYFTEKGDKEKVLKKFNSLIKRRKYIDYTLEVTPANPTLIEYKK